MQEKHMRFQLNCTKIQIILKYILRFLLSSLLILQISADVLLTTMFHIKKPQHSAHIVHLCALWESQNKEEILHYAVLIDMFF